MTIKNIVGKVKTKLAYLDPKIESLLMQDCKELKDLIEHMTAFQESIIRQRIHRLHLTYARIPVPDYIVDHYLKSILQHLIKFKKETLELVK